MRLRDEPTLQASELFDLISPPHQERVTTTDGITVNLTKIDPDISFQTGTGIQAVPATAQGILALGTWLDIPDKFLGRLDADIQDHLLNALLSRGGEKETLVQYDEKGVQDVLATNNRHIDPRRIIEIAVDIMGPDATVIDWRKDNTGYGFDIVLPITQDVRDSAAVGDVTRGGLRFGQDLKHNLAPWCERYLYRLQCTNGMEIQSNWKLNARGLDTDQIVDSLRTNAWENFLKLDVDLASFYALREERVENPERMLARIAGEHGLSDRTLANLVVDLPQYVDGEGHASMFDLVNLVTNYANDPTFQGRFAARRTLEVAGGRIANDHAARCPQCRSRLSRS